VLSVRPVQAFADNYIWLIHSPLHPSRVAVVDPGDAAPVIAELRRADLQLAAILLTHHHPDHIGGVPDLLRLAKVPVIGPDDDRIATRTMSAVEGQAIELRELGLAFKTLEIPGHTLSHIAFWGHDSVFSGDTLFSAGCGRTFEGTAQQMNHSLERLRALPAHTQVYCGHEYTASNLRFAQAVEPDNAARADYQTKVASLRGDGVPTLPSTLSLEIQVNPFLRCDTPAVRHAAEQHAGKPLTDNAQVFGELRAWKDQF
jgi:hydroxyacylglutathione hydrolase